METKPIQPLEMQMLAECREKLVAVRSSFLKRLNETEDPAAQKARDLLVRQFDPVIERALSHVAYSDGPIRRKEADALNALLGQNSDEAHYNSLFKRPEYRTVDPVEQFAVIVDAAIQLGGLEQGIAYDPQADPIIMCFRDLGQAVLAADGQMNDLELKCLTTYTSVASAKATALQERMGGLTDGIPADSAPPPPPLQEKTPAARMQLERNDNPASFDPIQRCIAELYALVGLASVKREVETLINLAKVFSIRKERGLAVPDISFHMVFSGNPGTGKTTVARIVAKVYGCLGLLSKGQLVEVDRSGLVANFVGQTATKARKVIDSAKGGVLFIDEAYALSRETDTQNDFGSEAIEVLLKSMEDFREDLVIIAAGYTDRMKHFLQSNPGLRSRFPRVIEFPD
jgi:ATPase family associated with various cellular activities (AAA)